MVKEKIAYRDNLERLDAAVPGTELLNCRQVMSALGIGRDRARRLMGGRKEISKATLARMLAK